MKIQRDFPSGLTTDQEELVLERLIFSCTFLKGLAREQRGLVAELSDAEDEDIFDLTLIRLADDARAERPGAPLEVVSNLSGSWSAGASRFGADYAPSPALLGALNSTLRAMAIDAGASERTYSPLVSVEDLQRSNYLSRFAHNVLLVGAIPHDLKQLEAWRANSDVEAVWRFQDMALRTALCFSAYIEHADEIVGERLLLTTSGTCFRHEAPWRLSPTRLTAFEMREIIFVGAPEWVEAQRQTWLQATWQLFCTLGLEGHIVSATDPFYYAEDRQISRYQQLTRAKYELVARADGGEVAIASFNNVREGLARSYGLQSPSDSGIHSGCAAFGLDRWAFVLTERYGADCERWPTEILSTLGMER
ncbi:hypothetical protein DFO47_103511 [Arthrobacter sp. AG258]|uniref:hypothetical protein n=1 Tax=Arthrobacter sp. AG258 TaxID=2183899 RepID=UPI00105B656C|nr:hypothetical protein [Arthrobacter sp. AG258]TDT81853.1 hypothetical protein DFO47_103511 [Arthrobacter sp. AG258]